MLQVKRRRRRYGESPRRCALFCWRSRDYCPQSSTRRGLICVDAIVGRDRITLRKQASEDESLCLSPVFNSIIAVLGLRREEVKSRVDGKLQYTQFRRILNNDFRKSIL